MSKVIFMFPGVGSHYPGMGKYFYDNFKIAKEVFNEASDVLKLDFPKMCFSKDENDKLNELENSQAALVCVSVATYKVLLQETGLTPEYCIGYSLGEYSALCCAGVIEYADTLQLVRDRGIIIKEVSSGIDGTMAWTVNLDVDIVASICSEFEKNGHNVYLSACDCPDKASISATNDILKTVGDKIVEHNGIMVPIKMSGPYHSPLMLGAAEKLRKKLVNYNYRVPNCKVIANQNAEFYKSKEDVIENLSLQLIKPILWKKSIDIISGRGGNIAFEIGPKNVLTYLLKRNTDKISGFSIDTGNDFSNVCNQLFISQNDCLDIISKCLVAVTSTKNYNLDKLQYEENVIKPYENILTIYKKLSSGDEPPNVEYAEEAIVMLQNVLKTKGLHKNEQERWLRNILGAKLFR